MYDKLFSRIIEAASNNSLALFVGAGVSKLSNAPSWKDLIDEICVALGLKPQETYSFDDNLRIAQMLYYHLNQDEDSYYRFIENKLSPSPLSPNEVHKELLKLNPHSIITTNFDELLEDAAIVNCQSFRVIACDSEVPSINGDRFILKVHGDLSHKNIVLKEEDYLNYSENFKLIETLLKAIFSTSTVVFIGYGLNDYNIKLVLNWAKTLLKDNFNKPIFIYTGSQDLSKEELAYQESKGLHVIEYYKACGHSDEYLSRYLSIIESIQKSAALNYDGKTAEEAFDITFKLLEPLDRLDALRVIDVCSKLEDNVHINEDGTIISDPEKCVAIEKFFRLNSLPPEDFEKLSKEDRDKFELIKRVFQKARIETLKGEFVPSRFVENNVPLADPNCILFDYQTMFDYAKQDYTFLKDKYLKAFYLARLYKYEQAFFLFTDIAKEAFKKSEYLLYYLSEVNRSVLYRISTNIHKYHRLYDAESIEQAAPWNDSEKLFNNLPVSFQKQYKSLRNLHSSNLLYQYSYDAFEDGQKLQRAIEAHTIEFGLTSAGKVISRINQYLHFLLGNHLLVDEFSEYKNTTRRMMDLLLQKYSVQDRTVLHEQLFPGAQDRITFDKIDFYCFLECFDPKELNRSLHKHQIETLVFSDPEEIETAVKNLVGYYLTAQKNRTDNIDLLRIQNLISTCLVLLRRVDISQELVDYLCEFLLKNDFREIMIDDKVLFLDAQVAKRHKVSAVTKKTIEDKLIWYLDSKIKAEVTGTNFEVFSRTSNINFANLVHYISPDEKGFHPRRLSIRISSIIRKDVSSLFKQIVEDYWAYLSTYQRYNVIKWAKEKLKENFSFDLLLLLLQCNARIDKEIIGLLKKHLNATIGQKSSPSNASSVTMVYPTKDPYEELNQVGYWCLIHALPQVFSEYLGISDRFDFYYLYKAFDFGKFDPAWLLHLNSHALKAVSKNGIVREKIRLRIADTLNNQKLEGSDNERLRTILSKYFC